jgi:hypothetical protein
MRFGVVVCSQCKRVQAVELRHQAVRCRGCQVVMPLAERKIFHRGDDERVIQREVARMAAQRATEPLDGFGEAMAAVEAEQRGTVQELLAALRSRAGPFTRDELEGARLELKVPGSADEILEMFLRESLVFEPRSGRFEVL